MAENPAVLNEAELGSVNGGYTKPCFEYVIRKGDALSVLAECYHTTVAVLQAINNILNQTELREGDKLLIPCSE